MIQPHTALDAISSWNGDQRAIVAVLGALFLGVITSMLSIKAENQNP
jgi:hypothetical protein